VPPELEDGDVIVAEWKFGIGSSREHAAIGLQRVGVGAVVAIYFSRIFYRNASNQGLAALRTNKETVETIVQDDCLRVDVF
jgi:3-isopropylmalate dehydratase small subunit